MKKLFQFVLFILTLSLLSGCTQNDTVDTQPELSSSEDMHIESSVSQSEPEIPDEESSAISSSKPVDGELQNTVQFQILDPMGDPSLHDAPLQTHGPVFEAMPVERAQDPDAGGAMPAHGRLEADVLLQFAGERADESVFRGSHDDPPSGTGSTHASIPPRCVAM